MAGDLNPALATVSRKAREHLLNRERRWRRAGDWGSWERLENPHRLRPGWLGEVDHVRRNKVFAVLVRDVRFAAHLAVSSLTGDRPTWHEMQRIKSDLAGPDATGIEVYPPDREIVDQADMFHLWIVSDLPFSLFDDRHKGSRNA
jgi:hypothetical protein